MRILENLVLAYIGIEIVLQPAIYLMASILGDTVKGIIYAAVAPIVLATGLWIAVSAIINI